jgi:hypothetical protein
MKPCQRVAFKRNAVDLPELESLWERIQIPGTDISLMTDPMVMKVSDFAVRPVSRYGAVAVDYGFVLGNVGENPKLCHRKSTIRGVRFYWYLEP